MEFEQQENENSNIKQEETEENEEEQKPVSSYNYLQPGQATLFTLSAIRKKESPKKEQIQEETKPTPKAEIKTTSQEESISQKEQAKTSMTSNPLPQTQPMNQPPSQFPMTNPPNPLYMDPNYYNQMMSMYYPYMNQAALLQYQYAQQQRMQMNPGLAMNQMMYAQMMQQRFMQSYLQQQQQQRGFGQQQTENKK